jgi:hypothetical protein
MVLLNAMAVEALCVDVDFVRLTLGWATGRVIPGSPIAAFFRKHEDPVSRSTSATVFADGEPHVKRSHLYKIRMDVFLNMICFCRTVDLDKSVDECLSDGSAFETLSYNHGKLSLTYTETLTCLLVWCLQLVLQFKSK